MKTAIIDTSYGDNGKARIADCLSGEYTYYVRYSGGPNSGHRIVHDEPDGRKTYILHHLPAGVITDKYCVLAAGMVINPISLLREFESLEIKHLFGHEMMISHDAHVIMPWHIQEDADKNAKIGTTKSGVGPAYAEKANRRLAIRMGELADGLNDSNIQQKFPENQLELYKQAAAFFKEVIGDTGELLRREVRFGTRILFEGSQGISLDVDHGDYPFVTSCGVGAAAIPQACGLPNLRLDNVIGVMKCHMTRVGNGPFRTEILDDLAEQLRKKGNEFGITTGRPRRIGWLDLDLIRKNIELGGITELALTHADTLADFEPVKVFVDGKYVDFDGWKSHEDGNFTAYLEYIEKITRRPVTMVSYGPERFDIRRFDKF